MAGYSETPLVKKLGIKSGFNLAFVNAPSGFASLLNLPSDVAINSRSGKPLDLVLLFTRSERDLERCLGNFKTRLKPAGMLWVAWPKKSAGIPTDLTFTNVQAIGLGAGLVDVKICAIDETWSGLKFVYRLEDRARQAI